MSQLLKDGHFKVDCQDGYWRASLSYAVEQGQTDAMGLLIDDWGANTEIEIQSRLWISDKSKTPLLYAASEGYTAVIRLLVENGANPDTADVWGKTPMFHAAVNGAAPAVKLLLHFGAAPNLTGSIKRRGDTSYASGMTPLAAATEIGQAEVVRVLLATGNVDVDTQDADNAALVRCASWVRRNRKSVSQNG
ncbi:hypothetical protein FQN51_000020 [Onygenales sp. PD_10]|nr:hypothetical protein FQN51_000020 [Onygenales sp. PD_10]